MKYGILFFKETDNIGDDIQTYTAKRFLPHIDYLVEREELNNFIPDKKEYVSVIMNGWYLHNKANWPPSPYINPLLHSVHLTNNTTIVIINSVLLTTITFLFFNFSSIFFSPCL